MQDEKDLQGKVVLVTGASRGIGYAASLEAARRGAHVIAVARTVGGLEELDDEIQELGSSATLVPLDLKDGDAIDRLGAAIFERWGVLDGLIANAAMLGVLSPLPHVSPEDFEKVMTINVIANYRLVRSLDLLLRQSERGAARLKAGEQFGPTPRRRGRHHRTGTGAHRGGRHTGGNTPVG